MHKTNEPDSAKSAEDGNKGFGNENSFQSAGNGTVKIKYSSNDQKNKSEGKNVIMGGDEQLRHRFGVFFRYVKFGINFRTTEMLGSTSGSKFGGISNVIQTNAYTHSEVHHR